MYADNIPEILDTASIIALCNRCLAIAGVVARVKTIEDVRLICSSTSVFVAAVECVSGKQIHGTIRRPQTAAERAHNAICMVNTLASMLSCDLGHISGERVVQGTMEDISNLLEIVVALSAGTHLAGHPQQDTAEHVRYDAVAEETEEQGAWERQKDPHQQVHRHAQEPQQDGGISHSHGLQGVELQHGQSYNEYEEGYGSGDVGDGYGPVPKGKVGSAAWQAQAVRGNQHRAQQQADAAYDQPDQYYPARAGAERSQHEHAHQAGRGHNAHDAYTGSEAWNSGLRNDIDDYSAHPPQHHHPGAQQGTAYAADCQHQHVSHGEFGEPRVYDSDPGSSHLSDDGSSDDGSVPQQHAVTAHMRCGTSRPGHPSSKPKAKRRSKQTGAAGRRLTAKPPKHLRPLSGPTSSGSHRQHGGVSASVAATAANYSAGLAGARRTVAAELAQASHLSGIAFEPPSHAAYDQHVAVGWGAQLSADLAARLAHIYNLAKEAPKAAAARSRVVARVVASEGARQEARSAMVERLAAAEERRDMAQLMARVQRSEQSQAHAERVSALRMTRVVDDIHASRAAAALRHVTRVEVALKEAVLSAIAGEKERLLAHRKEQAAHAGAAVFNMRRVLSVAEEQYRRQHSVIVNTAARERCARKRAEKESLLASKQVAATQAAAKAARTREKLERVASAEVAAMARSALGGAGEGAAQGKAQVQAQAQLMVQLRRLLGLH